MMSVFYRIVCTTLCCLVSVCSDEYDEYDEDYENDSGEGRSLSEKGVTNNTIISKSYDDKYKSMYGLYDKNSNFKILNNDVQGVFSFTKRIDLKNQHNSELVRGLDFSIWDVIKYGVDSGNIVPYSSGHFDKTITQKEIMERLIIPNSKKKDGKFDFFDGFDVSIIEISGAFVKSRFYKNFVWDNTVVSFIIPSDMFPDTGIERVVCSISYKQLLDFLRIRNESLYADKKKKENVTLFDAFLNINDVYKTTFSYYFTMFDSIDVLEKWKLNDKSDLENRERITSYCNSERKKLTCIF